MIEVNMNQAVQKQVQTNKVKEYYDFNIIMS